MKRLIISFILLAIVIISSFAVPIYVTSVTKDLVASIDGIEHSLNSDDIKTTQKKVIEFTNLWENKKETITIFVNHGELDNISYSNSKLLPLLKGNEKTQFIALLTKIKTIIIDVSRDELPNIGNIL